MEMPGTLVVGLALRLTERLRRLRVCDRTRSCDGTGSVVFGTLHTHLRSRGRRRLNGAPRTGRRLHGTPRSCGCVRDLWVTANKGPQTPMAILIRGRPRPCGGGSRDPCRHAAHRPHDRPRPCGGDHGGCGSRIPPTQGRRWRTLPMLASQSPTKPLRTRSCSAAGFTLPWSRHSGIVTGRRYWVICDCSCTRRPGNVVSPSGAGRIAGGCRGRGGGRAVPGTRP